MNAKPHSPATFSINDAIDPVLITRANAAAEAEKGLSFKQSLSIYRKAVFWSVCLSLALVMEGYDVGIVSGAPNNVKMMPLKIILSSRSIVSGVIPLSSTNLAAPTPLVTSSSQPIGRPHSTMQLPLASSLGFPSMDGLSLNLARERRTWWP